MERPVSLHVQRLDWTSSKLPTFRHVDILNTAKSTHWPATTVEQVPAPQTSTTIEREHARNQSESAASLQPTSSHPSILSPRPVTSPGGLAIQFDASSSQPSSVENRNKARKNPAAHSGNVGIEKGPPPAMLTSKTSFPAVEIENSTKNWVVNQNALTGSSLPIDERKPLPAVPQDSKPATPLIPPIRGFKTSRKSVEMNAASPRRTSMDQDDTLRALDGFNSQRPPHRDQEEQSSDDSDLFLKLAREEATGNNRSGPIRRVRARNSSY